MGGTGEINHRSIEIDTNQNALPRLELLPGPRSQSTTRQGVALVFASALAAGAAAVLPVGALPDGP
jgi:hypothetical protein